MKHTYIVYVSLLLLIVITTAFLGSTNKKINEHYNDSVSVNVQDVKLSPYKGTKNDRAIT